MLLFALTLLMLAMQSDFDTLWREYHSAGDAVAREAAWILLQSHGWPNDFARTVQRLRNRIYSKDVPTGELEEVRVSRDSLRYRYTVLIPESYDPERAYPVRVVLHGSTRRPAWKEGEEYWRFKDPFRSDDFIVVFPSAWRDALWWTQRQVDNLSAILDRLRARYHVDTNRCTLTGLSDGGTGTFYQALRAPTPWAAFLPLIGHPWVLGTRGVGADGDIFAANLRGRALMVVNGKGDRLYPAKSLTSYLDLFRRAGAEIHFKVEPGGHTVRWWPKEAAEFRAFRASHPRDAFPDTLVWETDDPHRNGRANWVVIESIGDEPAPDPDLSNTVLFPDLDPPKRAQAFPRRHPSGRVTVERKGNTISVQTRNVRKLKLLLGVNEFDFHLPIEVVLNGKHSRHEIGPSVATLMKWAIHDGDPALLVGAELELSPRP
jgi:enterochelin esterase-like enzyme